MSLVESFRAYIAVHGLFSHDDKILVAVSGGVDSMVLMRLMAAEGYRFAVAHCNFQLRGLESDGDEHLVEEEARRYGVEYHSIHFDTEGVMAETGESMEMAARRLRYEWLDKLCVAHGYDVVAIAHHLDDSIETHFINMLRGTGLRGLTGIAMRNKRIVRPMLFATRKDILDYAIVNDIAFREDSSNRSMKYLRNRVRHEVVPKLTEINAQYASVMARNMMMLDQAQQYIDASIALVKRDALKVYDNGYRLDVSVIDDMLPRNFVIYEILNSEFGFRRESVENICSALDDGVSGRRFYTSNMEAIVDRGSIIVMPRCEADAAGDMLLIDEGDCCHKYGEQVITFEYLGVESIATLNQGANVALLDADKLVYPLSLRVWRDGDSFVPFGMKGRKKISDFLVDNKVSIVDKRQQLLLLSDDRVVWVVGRRIDNRYAVTNNTRMILRVSVD